MPEHVQSGGILVINWMISKLIRDALSSTSPDSYTFLCKGGEIKGSPARAFFLL